jgi:conjugative transposon TraM protein
MENVIQGSNFLRRPKLMALAPPVFALILTGIFWSLDGGKGLPDDLKAAGLVKGVNMQLPDAKPDGKGKAPDKLDMYAKAAKDSAKFAEELKEDPYAAARIAGAAISGLDSMRVLMRTGDRRLQTDLNARQVQIETTADEVMQRMNQLKTLTKVSPQAVPGGWVGQNMETYPRSMSAYNQRPEIASPWKQSQQTASRPDGELAHLEGMLDKIYRVQHPDLVSKDTGGERVEVAVLERPGKEEPVRVLTGGGKNEAGRGGEGAETVTNAFMEIGETDANDSNRFAADAIAAVVAEEQTLTAGTTVALRLSQEAVIKGQKIPAGQEINGVATLNGERLHIAISSIRVEQTLVNVSLQVYDLDGLQGIRVPGAMTRDVSKQSADEALSGLGIASVDQNLSAQAANAGLQFARSLASRKVKLVRVSLPAGYRVLLRNTKLNNH